MDRAQILAGDEFYIDVTASTATARLVSLNNLSTIFTTSVSNPARILIDTAGLLGDFELVVRDTIDGETKSLTVGHYTILADVFAAGAVAQDRRSYNDKLIDNIKSILEERTLSSAQSYTIAGRSITKYSHQELHEFLLKLQNTTNAPRAAFSL